MQAWAQEAVESAASPSDAPVEQIDVSPDAIVITINNWIDGFFRLLPNIAVAIALLVVFFFISMAIEHGVRQWAKHRDRSNLGDVLGGFVKAVVIALGGLLALTIVLPSVKPGDLVAGLGIGSVAIGFAFKDILQNWLAGLLILLRQPFRPGDQIVINGYEGTIDHIETRVTAIRTYDGRMALIPNSDVYTNAVTVNTAFDKRRSQYDVGIGYGDNIADAKSVMLNAVKSVEGVEQDPAAEVLVVDLAASWITLRPRWWTNSLRTDVVHTQSRVIEAIKSALDAAGIDMPFETAIQLFHDQTEENDGVRGRQREGWPGAGDSPPRSRLQLTIEQVEASTDGTSQAPPKVKKKP
ncbi:mechanosensitive ion channel family protein [Devosia rhodophyticola]|uniref:Small-conductance mechanosensitive channel n=1 Tax=Devosia rhodophyticola TaxID=3026423 RepID=A0ABY7YUP6_9HYPH|nr:mechanosensitive ion channel family protein [Devosia rhodophyticola]WDR04575.1 mechanosensitive ion channel family protein [Devosia rhodophyticola]